MTVVCSTNLAKNLASPTLRVRYPDQTVFDLIDGKTYPVYSISLWGNDLYVLLSDENDLPNWYPIELFSVCNSRIDSDWEFSCFPNDGHLRALWGYAQMINDENHYDALLERDADAVRIFVTEKIRRSSAELDPLA
jgi:hypothetical protein